jgi:FMN phosphatase YigB (HAD superfamily)
MWMADLRAVTFSNPAVLRLTRPDALRFAARSALAERLPARIADFDGAWAVYEAERARRRWHDQHEQPVEVFLKDLAGDDAGAIAKEAALHFGECLEWHADALPTLDYLRESGYRTALLLDLPVPLPPDWKERSKPWFDATVSSTDVLRRTPDPAPFQEALGLLRLGPPRVLHVGLGLVEDVHAAQTVQIRSALLERFGRPPPDPAAGEWLARVHGLEAAAVAPDLKLRTLEDLPRALDAFA